MLFGHQCHHITHVATECDWHTRPINFAEIIFGVLLFSNDSMHPFVLMECFVYMYMYIQHMHFISCNFSYRKLNYDLHAVTIIIINDKRFALE